VTEILNVSRGNDRDENNCPFDSGLTRRCLNGAMTLYAIGEERPRIHPDAYIHPEAVLIGDVRLGPGSSVWPGAVIRADNGPIIIGARTSIQDGAVIHTQAVKQTRIGDDCVIGHLAHLEGCVIEDAVLIGSGSVVLEGVTCRTGSLVGAGAVVSPGMEVPSGAMALGVPARIREGGVTAELVRINADAYSSRHLPQHRDDSHEVSLAACLQT
jgi:carbonic anhydrase/acetyltransferase-like protein (isoleucine patch superfamily)